MIQKPYHDYVSMTKGCIMPMFFDLNKEALRQQYFSAWQRYQDKELLSQLEQEIVTVILQHSEYQAIFDYQINIIDQDHSACSLQENPFLHLGLHLAIREQLQTNRPTGILNIYNILLEKYTDAHQVEHYLMHVLMNLFLDTQKIRIADIEQEYIKRLNCCIENSRNSIVATS